MNNFHKQARAIAEHAGSHDFRHRWGTYDLEIEGRPVIAIFNNNPYADPRMSRDAETELFREWLLRERIEELAYEADSTGYSFAMIVDGRNGRTSDVRSAYQQVLMSCQEPS